MSATIAFAVDGRPVSKNRALRFASGRAYRTPASREYQARVAWSARLAMRDRPPIAGPVRVALTCWLRDRRGLPDADGVAKALLDGCNGIVWVDDRQVCDLRVIRTVERGCDERVDVTIRAVDAGAVREATS